MVEIQFEQQCDRSSGEIKALGGLGMGSRSLAGPGGRTQASCLPASGSAAQPSLPMWLGTSQVWGWGVLSLGDPSTGLHFPACRAGGAPARCGQ